MFLIRQSKPEDVSTLVKMAKMVYFINLPPNEQLILNKIEHSNKCFSALLPRQTTGGGRQAAGKTAQEESIRTRRSTNTNGLADMEHDSDFFMFTMEDMRSGSGVVGTSQVRAHQGGPGNPNWSFKISEKRHYSESLKFGTTHAVGQLFGDETGPSELGGLIIQPSYRGHQERPGRFLSFVRFHFIALFREIFAERIIAEMMAPVTAEGDNIFWDAFGRKFIPVKFAEADRFCQHNRSFIPDLLPKEEIYLSLFPLEVQNSLGVVSRDTIPARRLLETLGFKYRGYIDSFDGGPHLDAQTNDVPLVRDTRKVTVGASLALDKCKVPAMISSFSRERGFRATMANVEWDGEASTVRTHAEALSLLGVKKGDSIGFTPISTWVKPEDLIVTSGQAPAKSRAVPRPRAKRPTRRKR